MTSRERNMLVILGVVAVGALAFFFLVVLGGEEPEEAAPTSPISSPPPIPATPGTGVGEPTPEPPRAVTFFGGRDPFLPLVEAPAEPTDGGAPAPDGSPVPPDGEPAPDGSPIPPDGEPADGTDGAPADGTDGTDGIGVTGKPVVLTDVVDESTVEVEVAGEPFTVTEGQRFARSYQVLSVESTCARFLYGDESFTLCKGQPLD